MEEGHNSLDGNARHSGVGHSGLADCFIRAFDFWCNYYFKLRQFDWLGTEKTWLGLCSTTLAMLALYGAYSCTYNCWYQTTNHKQISIAKHFLSIMHVHLGCILDHAG